MLETDGMSDAISILKQHSPSAYSPIAAMADPRIYVADRHVNLPKTTCLFVASPEALTLCLAIIHDWFSYYS